MRPEQTVTLRQGGVAAEIAPSLGAAILSFAFHGRDLLRPGTAERAAADPRNAACYPCVPWFGRLHGGIDFGGRHWDLAPTLPACDPVDALHGEGWVRPWAVTAHTDVFIECLFSNDGVQDGQFPFPYEARQIVQIADGALVIDLFVRNIGSAPMPAGLGLHPFFPRDEKTRVSFAAGGVRAPGAEAAASIPASLNFCKSAALPAGALDHSYSAFGGSATIDLGDAAVTLESDAPTLHLFAPAGADYFCAEPVTHFPGDFGGDSLDPGESSQLSLRLRPGEA